MIGTILKLANQFVEIRVNGNVVYFKTSELNMWAPIEGIKLNYQGVIKEFPDLIGSNSWEAEAIKRFKEKIKSFSTEEEKINYIMEDLKQHGYTPYAIQKQGHRLQKL